MSISCIRSGEYFILDLKLTEETRPIGKWGRMHRDYLKEHHPSASTICAVVANCGHIWLIREVFRPIMIGTDCSGMVQNSRRTLYRNSV